MEVNLIPRRAKQVLSEHNCCMRCMMRMLCGQQMDKKGIANTPIVVYKFPICPLCCGLLHHPDLCSADNRSKSNLIQEVVNQLHATDYEYLACVLKASEPILVVLRENMIWSKLHRQAANTTTDDYSFTQKQLNIWQETKIGLRDVWKAIISNLLSEHLKVPIFQMQSDVSNSDLIEKHKLDSNSYPPECTVLSIQLGFAKNPDDTEIEHVLEDLSCCEIPAITKCLKQIQHKGSTIGAKWLLSNATLAAHLSTTDVTKITSVLRSSKYFLSDYVRLSKSPSLAVLGNVLFERCFRLVIAGRYVKLDRQLPQTPWIIEGQRKQPSSIEELIVNPLKEHFGSNSRMTFIGAGREDVDVRCLGLGRSFAVQIDNYEAFVPELARVFSTSAKPTHNDHPMEQSDLLGFAELINSKSGGKVFVRDLQFVTPDSIKNIKDGETKLSKCYRAICHCADGGLNSDLLQRLVGSCSPQTNGVAAESASPPMSITWPPPACSKPDVYNVLDFGKLKVEQETPIRVLHRRANLIRPRNIEFIRLADYASLVRINKPEFKDYLSLGTLYPPNELFVLEVTCDAGTYVKEFVHGDLGRCRPSLTSIFGKQVNLISLDVIAVNQPWPARLPAPMVPQPN